VKVVTNVGFIWRLAAAAKKKQSDLVKHELKKPLMAA
jgi:hypothetical protein